MGKLLMHIDGKPALDGKTVRRIAHLARIKITDAEVRGLEAELSGLLGWVAQLDEVDTDGVEPMTRVVPIELRRREDKVTAGEMAEAITRNAPATEDGFFVVPKVVE